MRLNKLLPGKQLGVTTASWSVVLIYLPMLRSPRALGCNTYLSLWFSFMLSVSAVFVPFLPHPLLSTVYRCDGCLSSQWCGGSCIWLAGQVLPAIDAVSTLELAANSGSSRMSQAPNLSRATQLFNNNNNNNNYFIINNIIIIILIYCNWQVSVLKLTKRPLG